jgi:serine/threonine-protein kinase
VASAAWIQAGCAGVQKRPDPEPCPQEAVKAMEELEWRTGTAHGPFIVLDVTQGEHPDYLREHPEGVFKDGPVTGSLMEPYGKAPAGMRLDGHLWTTGDRIYGRYVRAHLPGGRTVPICVELIEDSVEYGIPKSEGSKPGYTVGPRRAATAARKWWR